eukprot:TRINITY_DN138_c0_g1_i1.p1 TRINITY_DN138_c0_g1~~TRINITY_DN138_c0_g1_i1.p1  ORF type:complete len:388 (-),score=108.18 TRINITY_DN138_c0_g1_i1:287-1450(-)
MYEYIILLIVIIVIISIIVGVLYYLHFHRGKYLHGHKKWKNFSDKHIIVTGGSSGIGKEVARLLLAKGAYVTIIARTLKKLEDAQKELGDEINDISKIWIESADISNEVEIKQAIENAEETIGIKCSALICSAGVTNPRYFEDLTPDDFRYQMNVNILGTIFSVRAVLPQMKKQNFGKIIIVSSQVAQTGMFGYTAYSTSKYALRGFAESLYPEVKPYNIFISVSYPPDTDTPMYEQEMKIKPIETVKMSESGSVFSSKNVAKDIVNSFSSYKFTIYHGFDGFVLNTLSGGLEPSHNIFSCLLQSIFFPILRPVWNYIYLSDWYKIAFDYHDNPQNQNRGVNINEDVDINDDDNHSDLILLNDVHKGVDDDDNSDDDTNNDIEIEED